MTLTTTTGGRCTVSLFYGSLKIRMAKQLSRTPAWRSRAHSASSHRHHQSSSVRGAPSLPAIIQHPPQSVVTLVKGTHLVLTLQSAVASEAAGVPCPWVGRPIWHREQDTFSGEDKESANVSHSQAHFCLQCIWCPTGWRSKGCIYLPVWRESDNK